MNETEELDIVDDADRTVGRATRARVHDAYLIHRSVMFYVFDDEDRVFVNQRSARKSTYPQYWSIAFGGHVLAGESYDDAVIRELAEETGLGEIPFMIGSFQKRTADERENVRVYGVRAHRDLELYADEIEQGQFVTPAQLNEFIGRFEFLPETPALLKILTEHMARNV
jgi:isopentenyldiphosphate isomerase